MGEMFATDVKVLDVATKKLLKSASSQGDGIDSILKIQINTLSSEVSRVIGIPKGKSEPATMGIADVTTDSMEAYQLFLKGKEAYERFYNEEAIQHFEKALEFDPQFAAAYLYLGHAKMDMLERDAAIEAYTKAKTFSDRATEKERLFIEAEYVSWVEVESGEKFRILNELAEKYPREKQVYLDLGGIYRSRHMYNEAIENFYKALELDPNWGYVLNILAYTHSDIGNYAQAIKYFQKYIDVSPGDANPIDSMAELYFRMGRFDEAILKYQEALKTKPGFESSLRIAIIYALKENYASSEEWLERFITETDSPSRKAEGYLWKGIFDFLLGKRERAFENLLKAEDFADRIRAAIINLTRGWMYYDLGQFDLSQEFNQKTWDVLLLFFPDSIRFTAVYESEQGIIEVGQGKIDTARVRLERIEVMLGKAKTPEVLNTIKYLSEWLGAEILMAEGLPEQAIEILENMETRPVPSLQTDEYGPYNFPYQKDFLARAYIQSGRLNDAISEYERKIEFVPGDKDYHLIHPVYHYLLAKLFQEKGLSDNSIEQYEQYLMIMKDADPGIAEIADAKKRLGDLKK